MGAGFFQTYRFYSTVLRLWLFLVLLMLIVSVMFPVRLPLCGTGANSSGGKFRFLDFALVLASNGVAGAILVKIRLWRFLIPLMLVAIVLISWVTADVFSIDLRNFSRSRLAFWLKH
jgi:hypothetical protein